MQSATPIQILLPKYEIGLSTCRLEILNQLPYPVDHQQPRMTSRQLLVFQTPRSRMRNIHRP